jgi:DeoR/GlpR family transcriptional regulator of sugar metabolism
MYQEERLSAILQHLQQFGRISVDEVCAKYNVSRDTARRDIVKLEEQQLIVRTRGGALHPSHKKGILNYEHRLNMESEEKKEIGRYAASLIRPGDYLIMDSSTTVQHAAACMSTKNNVVVTNCIDIASILTSKEGIAIQLLGGTLHPELRNAYGARTIATLSEYQVDKLFLGTSGITPEGFFCPSEEYGYLMKEMIRRTDQVILLADHSKFGKKTFHHVGSLSQIDMLITDKKPNNDIIQQLVKYDVELIVVGE